MNMASRNIKVGVASALLFLSVNPAMAKAPNPPYGVAQVDLGFSGAKLVIRSTPVLNDRGADHRVMTIITASGKRRELTLKDGGGHLGNNGLNLYTTKGDGFLLLSQKDCVRIDPLKPMRPKTIGDLTKYYFTKEDFRSIADGQKLLDEHGNADTIVNQDDLRGLDGDIRKCMGLWDGAMYLGR